MFKRFKCLRDFNVKGFKSQRLILANIGQKVKIACTIFVCEPTTKLMVLKERLSLKYLL